MKYYLVAGEASGDLHGSNLMKALRKKDPEAEFRFYGGDLMKSAGGLLVRHYREMAFMGFTDVIANIRTITKNMNFCRNDILDYKPDALILIDYPGFNLRIAGHAHRNGIKVFYYISPKVWASRESRVRIIRKYVDKLFVIFPFEKEYFRQKGINVDYLGNPVIDSVVEFRKKKIDPDLIRKEISPDRKPVIALLSGSREHEVSQCLPEMVKSASYFKDYQFVVAGVPTLDPSLYHGIIAGSDVKIVFNRTYELLNIAHAAIVTSGTATLETVLFRVPQVVIYRIGKVTYNIGKLFVKIRFFSLVNILAEREIVKELLQNNLAKDIKTELAHILGNTRYVKSMLEGYNEIITKLGKEGTSLRIADKICEMLK